MTDAESQFSAEVLRNLLRHIEQENANGSDPFLVSHAWTEGPMMYLVYTAPPSDIIRGLARDTRESIIDPGPWHPQDDSALYYYLCDLEESRVSASFRHPGEPDTILWHGYPREGHPEHTAEIPAVYRYTPPTVPPAATKSPKTRPDVEPRRYGNKI